VVDASGPVRLCYSERNSLLAQISTNGVNPRVADKLARNLPLSDGSPFLKQATNRQPM
jgi:hypothetical protein